MSVPARQKFGVLLLAISVASFFAFLVVGVFRGDWHFDGSGSSGNGSWAAYSGELKISDYYLIPIFLCGLLGVFFLVWRSRKPPKLNQ